jgi:hypothetical protein
MSAAKGAPLAQRLLGHVQALARWERLTGTPEERAAFEYIRQELESFGLRPELIAHDAYISLPGKASLAVATPEGRQIRCITHSFSQPTPPGGLMGELVYVGRGMPTDYAGLDVQGKVVLMEGLAAPGPAVNANRFGAAAHIHINPKQYIHEMIISPVWGSPTAEQVELLPKTVALSVNHEGGEYLKEMLKQGPVRVHLHAEVDTGWRKIPLLTVQIGGEAEPEQFVLFSGHVDSWYFGAMDNGSANAVMLEMARHFAGMPLRRSLRLAFWSGHSHGRYAGSAWYVDQHFAELDRHCVAHVNIDSPGGRGATVIDEPQAMAEAGALLQETIGPLSGGPVRLRRVPRAGDHSLWGLGIPSLMVGPSEQLAGPDTYNPLGAVMTGSDERAAGYGWWWHTPDDTPDKLDPAVLERDAAVYRAILERLLNDSVLPFDYNPVVAELRQAVAGLSCAGIDMAPVEAALDTLALRAGALAEVARMVAPEEAAALNARIMGVARILIPLLYTGAGRFHPDPALGQPPVPSLEPLRKLAGLDPDTEAAKFHRVAAVRALNQFRWMIEQAASAAALA